MKKYKIAITTGDKKGIGKEITKKALDILKPKQDEVLIIGEKTDNCNCFYGNYLSFYGKN